MQECDLNITLSFEYSVNSRYSIEYITKKSKEKCNSIIFALFQKLEELSKLTIKDLQNRPRESGYEMIPLSELNFEIDNDIKQDLELSNDSKVIVFRFNKQDCRLITAKSPKCKNLLYVLAYDWNFSAYNHGS